MTEHSPGPWQARPHFVTELSTVVYAADGNHVCTCWASAEPCEVNARLIAAAPDMLKALLASRRYVEILEKHLDPTIDPGAPTIREHASMVRDAIAKATGDKR